MFSKNGRREDASTARDRENGLSGQKNGLRGELGSEWVEWSEPEPEVVANDVHALPQVKTVGVEALHAGVELEFGAAGGAGVGDEPGEKRGAVAAGTVGGAGDEVVHVEEAAGDEILADAEAGDGADQAVFLQGDELVAAGALALDAGQEVGGVGQVRAEFAHDGQTAGNGGGSGG